MRYFIFTLFALFFAGTYVQGQGAALTDSMSQALLHAKEDTNKARLLDALSFAYYTIDPAKGIQYGRQLIALSTKLEWKTGLAMGYADLGINYEAIPDHAQALENDLMALKLCEQLGNKKGMFGNLANISVIYVDQSNYPKALEYALQALWMSEELGEMEDRASILSNIAVIYLERNNYIKALQYESAALIV
ncbi:MAG TPA: tetratricopeptide repeat protein, partial [Candidatus Babeliaceae bacterium]|nr:tetratricopeptide repeat protein [Candidatus Babeliaceae bacterium]